MEDFISYFSLLGNAIGSVAALLGYSLAGLVVTWLSGVWILLLLIPKIPKDNPPESLNEWLWLHPALLAVGWATLIAVSTASLYLTKGMRAGELLLVMLAVVSGVLLWRRRPRIRSSDHVTLAVIGLTTLMLGLWQHAATALPVPGDIDYLAFSDLHLDLPIHVTMAGMIRDSGLPLINMSPSSTHAYSAPSHVGHAIAIASYSSVLGISLYAASTVGWIIATMLTGWCAVALLFTKARLKVRYSLTVVLATLAIGQFTLPWLHDPTNPKAPLVTGIWLASRSYWNISQAISIALTMGGLLVLDRYCEFRRSGQAQLLVLGTAVALITIGGLVKPSLIIFFGPGLIIWLAVSRARMLEYLVTVVVLQAGFMAYFLPRFLHAVPTAPGWSLAPEQGQWAEVALFLWHSCLGLTIIVVLVIARSIANGWRDRQWQVVDLAVIALAGSVLFALLFRENRFVGFPVLQPNIWWGISGCVVLLVPLLSRELAALINAGGRMRWVVALSLVVGAIQIANGLYVAWVYPVLNQRTHEVVLAETLAAARELTAPSTRFALDPSLEHFDLRPFLSRPSLMRTSYSSPNDTRAYANWRAFIKLGRTNPPIDRLDAVVLHNSRTRANSFFAKLGWQASHINERYTLWRRGETNRTRQSALDSRETQ